MNRKQRRAAGSRNTADSQNYLIAHASHARGDLDKAHAHYLRALAQDPEHPGCLMGLGLIAFSRRVFEEAEQLLRLADENQPNDATILGNLAAVLLETGKQQECIEICERVLKLDANSYVGLTNLSFMIRDSDAARAVDLARRAIGINAKGTNAKLALGHALNDLGTQAAKAEALATYQALWQSTPGNSAAALSLARLLIEQGHAGQAITVLESGSARHADDVNFPLLLVQACMMEADYERARAPAERVRDAMPGSAAAQSTLAQIYKQLKRTDDALAACEAALQIDPDMPGVKLELCALRQKQCHWEGLELLQREAVDHMLFSKTYAGPFHLISMEGDCGSALTQRRASEIYYEKLGEAPVQRSPLKRKTSQPLRIGYLSSDYTEHATATLISELIERHDRSKFEIVAYCYTSQHFDNYARDRLKRSFDRFVELRDVSIEDSAKRIHNDEIDILVDLKGFTSGSRSRIMKYRPAPIQVNYLGYPGTMGSEDIDYIIGDPFTTPMAHQAHFAEKIVQLPHCYQPNDTRRRIDGGGMGREDHGLPANAFVFCSFNNVNKLTRRMFQVWMRLLKAVPGSVLWLLTTDRRAQENLQREAASCGVEASRIVFAPHVAVPRHIARMKLADLFLDSFPCTAHTTASEAMWAGLPMITCAGETFASRVAGSIVTSAGFPELVTETLKDYEALALNLAQNREQLSALRGRLAHVSASPLFDISGYTRDLEAAYLHMAQTYDSGLAPQAFAVRDLSVINEPEDAQPEVPLMANVMDNLILLGPAVETLPPPSVAEAPSSSMLVKFDGCPLCKSTDIAAIGESDITRHALYQKRIPEVKHWCFCEDCNHTFAESYLGEAALQMIDANTPAAEIPGRDLERNRLRAAKIVHRIADRAGPGLWLGVGIGNGALQFTAAEWGFDTISLDRHAENVTAMRTLGYEAHVSTLEALTGDNLCSVISMMNGLHRLPDPAATLAAARRLLKPDGVLFLVLPNMDTMTWRRLDQQRTNPYWSDVEICHHFTRARLYQLLMQNGLVPVEYNVSEDHCASMEVTAVKMALEATD